MLLQCKRNIYLSFTAALWNQCKKSVPGLYNEDNLFNDTIKNLHMHMGNRSWLYPTAKQTKLLAKHFITDWSLHLEKGECYVFVSLSSITTFLISFSGSSFQIPPIIGHLHTWFSESDFLISLILPAVWTDPIHQKKNRKLMEMKNWPRIKQQKCWKFPSWNAVRL